MKRGGIILFAMVLGIALPAIGSADAGVNPVVTTAWLQENITGPSIILVDIRKVEEYREGHIPDSINLTFNAWRTMEGNIGCQLPQKDELADTVCSVGAEQDSRVIIIGKTERDVDLVNTTRVAWTLRYAGLRNLSILEGGYNKWANESRQVTTKPTRRAKSNLKCNWNDRVLASRKDVAASCAGKAAAAIIDTRPEGQFTGRESCPSVRKKGHIPGAINLPYSFVFTKEGMFKSKDYLQGVASKNVGENRDREIIVVCSNGQFASSWWFVLSEMLGYRDVRIYDGSMEDWCCDEAAPLTAVPTRR